MQIAESVAGQRRIVRHVGSARDEAELGLLIDQAEQMLADDLQGELDLGMEVPQRTRAMVAAPAVPALLGEAFGNSGPRAPKVVARGRVMRSFSQVLYDVLGGVYDELGFDVVNDVHFRDLVIARIVEPTSLLDVDRVLADLGRKSASHTTRKRTLRRAQAGGYRDKIAIACFNHALNVGDVSLVLYDVTTLYFEAEKEDDLRKVGYSKERRIDPQIVVGLLVDRAGFPLEIGCFEGNKAETLTILPIIEAFQARHGVENMVVVADAGMLSRTNLGELDEAGFGFIVGSRQTKAPLDLASHYRWHGEAFTDGQIIDTLTPKHARARPENDTSLKDEPAWSRSRHPGSWRAIWSYSARRFARDNKNLNAQEARARAVIAGENTARRPRFVKPGPHAPILDEANLARARRIAGLKGYVTNIPATVMDAAEVLSSYHDLWHVEQSFRMSKTDLRARPIFARTSDAIEAHLTIVFTALAISRTVQTRTGTTIRRILRELRPLRSATIEINGTKGTYPPAINNDQQTLLDAITSPTSRH